MIAIFAPLRLIGTFLANDALKGMDTVQYSVTAESVRLAAVTAVILSISASMLSPDPAASARLFSRLRPLGANYRQVCWTGLIVSTCLFVILAGSVPLLSDGAESERIAAQAGRAYLVFVAYVAGVVLAIDIAVRLRRGFYSTATAYVRLGIVATLLLASASRLPALVALTAFFAASVSLRRSEGLPVVKQIIVAPALGVVFAATVGAARASYVGFTGGWSSVLEHFLRRVAADAGNLALLSSRDLGTLISPTEFVSAPFVTYLPGSQRNLGQLLKDRLGLVFDGGGITVPMPIESFGMFGPVGLVLAPMLGCLLAASLSKTMVASRLSTDAALFLAAVGTGFVNLGLGGLSETLGSAVVPFAIIALVLYSLGKSMPVRQRAGTHVDGVHA